jgi:ABC-type dipeptide/oligopeptide/nickel transport system permease component
VLRFIASRILQAIPVVFLIAVVSFGLMQLAPGGPQAQFNQNPHITQDQIDAWMRRWCLEPNADATGILREFGGWLGVWNCETQSLLSEQGP